MQRYVVEFEEVGQDAVGRVGGKGAHLAELSRIEGIRVPRGFCVTTDAFQRAMRAASPIAGPLGRLAPMPVPDDVATEVLQALGRLGEQGAYAVRSSATAEDSPTASFAGLHDTYLNIVGAAAILESISRCWASLFSERAVAYRLHSGMDQRELRIAVVVQRMVLPQASGILFTADPVTGNRKVASVDASLGLGEALVAGHVNPDVYKVRDGTVISRSIGSKCVTTVPLPGGGTAERTTDAEQGSRPTLSDEQVVELVQLGRTIEQHFGSPQDIEWCLADGEFQFVQSRPITTLFPIPKGEDDENRVYVSVGHQQMMTDPMKPLGLSLWQLTAGRPMREAAGRPFIDVTDLLSTPASRANIIGALGKSDPLIGDALQSIVDRGDFVLTRPDTAPAWMPPGSGGPPLETDAAIPTELIAKSEATNAALARDIQGKAGSELLAYIRNDIEERRKFLFDPRSMQVVMAAMEANWWLNDKLQGWLGEKNAADVLTQSVPNNVTSEMGLALLDVADAIRPYPEVVAFLKRVDNEDFLSELPALAGGREARDAIQGWLDRYGMRGVGEIDITRPRFSERPTMLIPILLGHIANFEPGAATRRFEEGRRAAEVKEGKLLERLRALPDGEEKAEETKRMIDRVRTFAGYREYPKYGKISRDFIHKKALMEEADRLVQAGVLRDRDDINYLRFEELEDVVRTQHADAQLIEARKEAHRVNEALTPPRVITSEGEMLSGSYRRGDVPAGALVGLAVSAGSIEGRARVILDVANADLAAGDILVTTYTDPSWTPLFVTITGLVTEVGGLMTHGAVIAREYGLPAVVGVENATRLIKDGQRIRVNGVDGYVELLPERGDGST